MDFATFAKVLHREKKRINESRKVPPTTTLLAKVYTQRYTSLYSMTLECNSDRF